MNIRKSDSNINVEHKQKKDFLSTVVNEIFLICQEDKNFKKDQTKVKDVDQNLNELKQRVSKQNSLIKKSEELKSDFKKKLTLIDNANFKMRARLLESLGSEI